MSQKSQAGRTLILSYLGLNLREIGSRVRGFLRLPVLAEMKDRFPFKKFLYWLRYRIGEYCLRGFVVVLPRIPHRLLALFTSAAARLTFVILWRYRKRMEENVSMAMGEEFLTEEKRRTVVRMAWSNFARGVYETACTLNTSREMICATVVIQGEEYLKQALERGKGVIALSAHLGNFTMIGPRLAAAGYLFSVVVKQPRDQRFTRLIDHYRARVGVKTISAKPRREAVRQILSALRRNEVVLLIADEFKSGDVEVDFLGCTVPAPRGPVTLALRTGSAVVPMFVTRDHEDRLTLRIGSEINLIKTGDLQEDVTANVALFTRHLEGMVRRYPDQWNWLGFQRNSSQSKNPRLHKMARVLHLYSDRKWTGAAEPVVNLCRELRSQFSITLIHENHKRKPVLIAPMAAERGVPVAAPLYLRKHHSLIHVAIDVQRLVSYIKKQGIRLVHVHRLGDHMVGGPAGWATATPVLRTLYSEAPSLSFGEKLMLGRFTDGLIVPNDSARANILNQLKNSRARICVVPPGVDTARFDPKRVSREYARRNLGIGPDEYVLGIASRIRSNRKVGAAVEAFGMAQKKLAHLRLVIMGWGKKSNIEKCILEPVKRFVTEDRVLHLGYLEGESYVEALSAIDAGIYLAPGSDESCRTVLEFMAMGKPLIVGNQGILSGLVGNAENGLEVECDAEKIAEAIVHLGSDPFLSEKMGERSLARVRERFSLNLQAAAISEIYKQFLSAALFVQSVFPLDQAWSIF